MHEPTTPSTRPRILVVGEALVDVVDGSAGLTEHPGGSPLNIALGLARLGRRVTLLTEIGTDARGRSIEAHLRDCAPGSVELAAGSVREERTSTATARLRSDGSAEYEFDLRWSLPADGQDAGREGHDEGTADEAGTAPDLVHVGSIAAFLEPGGSQVVELLRGLEPETVVAVDPNIRPSIVPSHEEAVARFEEIARLATLVKLSDEDAAWLYPSDSVDGAITRILGLGAGLVVVTRGGDGADLASHVARCRIPGRPVDVVDTIGAGDSFMSALIDGVAGMLEDGAEPAHLRDGKAFDEAALVRLGGFAARCAAVTVSRAGANPPTRADVAA